MRLPVLFVLEAIAASWITSRFSALFSSAALVKLNEPVKTVAPVNGDDFLVRDSVLRIDVCFDSFVG